MAHMILQITTITERVEGECPACRFDALIRCAGYTLSANGVHEVFDMITCGRCRAEERRERNA